MSPAGRPRSGQGPTGPSSASGHAATQDPRASRLPARPGSAGVPGLHPPPPPPLPPRLRPSSSKFALGLKFLPSFAHRSARVPRPSPRGLGGGFEGGGRWFPPPALLPLPRPPSPPVGSLHPLRRRSVRLREPRALPPPRLPVPSALPACIALRIRLMGAGDRGGNCGGGGHLTVPPARLSRRGHLLPQQGPRATPSPPTHQDLVRSQVFRWNWPRSQTAGT